MGSDPVVTIVDIHWRGWGRPSTSGVGRYDVPHICFGGSYYRKRLRSPS